METLPLGLQSWERTIRAVELIKKRLLRATAALETAGVACAVIGGNAVAAWSDASINPPCASRRMSVCSFVAPTSKPPRPLLKRLASVIGMWQTLICSLTGRTPKPGTRSTSSSPAKSAAGLCLAGPGRGRVGGFGSLPRVTAGRSGSHETHFVPRQGPNSFARFTRRRTDRRIVAHNFRMNWRRDCKS